MLELIQYGITAHACFPLNRPRAVVPSNWAGLQPMLLGVAALALVVGGTALLVAWRNLRRTAQEHRGRVDELLEVGEGRTRFLAVWGMLLSGGFLVAIILQILALVLVPPCEP